MQEDKLTHYVTAIELLQADNGKRNDEIKSLLADAKAAGFLPSAIKGVIKLRSMPKEDVERNDTAMDLYRSILKV